MKKLNLLSSIFIALFLFTACSDKDDDDVKETYTFTNTTEVEAINIQAANEISFNATTMQPIYDGYTKYSFSEKGVVTGDNWDMAFNGYSIIFNGGTSPNSNELTITGKGASYITDGTLDNVTEVVFNNLTTKDYTYTDWGVYNHATRMVSVLAGKVFVIKTHDGNYVKMRIDSYYKDSGDLEAGANYMTTTPGYYTFTYIYN